MFSQAYWPHSTAIHNMIRAVGFLALAICIFGRAYRRYRNTIPRFRPTWYRWRDVSDVTCRPALFVRTVRDACWFVAAVPLCEAVKMAQDIGWIKPLIRLF